MPADVRDAARKALLMKPREVPDVTYRLASGLIVPEDLAGLALWHLDHFDQQTTSKVTVDAALRGGRAGRAWALAAPEFDIDYERLLNDAVRSDQHLVPELAAAIKVAWERQLDHATRKARSRMTRSTESRAIEFTGFPNKAAAQRAGIDDLMDKAWDAFKVSIAAILADYARTQSSLVAGVDPIAAASVLSSITARAEQAALALVAFMDTRMREFLLGDVPYEPQDFLAARAVASWVSGALPAPDGYAFVDLASVGKMTITRISTAQSTLVALANTILRRDLQWVHGFYGQPMQPFQPHEEVDGRTLTESEAASLIVFPGDHVGCRCELVPTWVPA